MVQTGWFSPAWNRQIDLVRNLGRQFVKRQGGDQTDDAIWALSATVTRSGLPSGLAAFRR